MGQFSHAKGRNRTVAGILVHNPIVYRRTDVVNVVPSYHFLDLRCRMQSQHSSPGGWIPCLRWGGTTWEPPASTHAACHRVPDCFYFHFAEGHGLKGLPAIGVDFGSRFCKFARMEPVGLPYSRWSLRLLVNARHGYLSPSNLVLRVAGGPEKTAVELVLSLPAEHVGHASNRVFQRCQLASARLKVHDT